MRKKRNAILVVAIITMLASCNSASDKTENKNTMKPYSVGSFGYDLGFLKEKDSALVVLTSGDGNAQVIVSPKYQAKVFTSTANGLDGGSFGWINYKAFSEPVNEHMNAYGGEDRLWLGPEGGTFSLFFKPNTKMEFSNWHTPSVIDTESWTKESTTEHSISMSTNATLTNFAGTPLQIKIDRLVAVLSTEDINTTLGISVPNTLKSVGFKTSNSITNTGEQAWTETTGMPCLWNLDMFTPSEKCVIVIPYQKEAQGKIATTDYFGEIAKDRIKMDNGILYFKADGKSRGKLGLPPNRVANIAGSYDAIGNVLTIVKYDINPSGKYLNQEWRTDRAPFSGDAMNAYNDGPLADGSQMGPFYELESVSPAAFLKPKEKMVHNHSVFHFIGDKKSLNEISEKLLGISLDTIEKAL